MALAVSTLWTYIQERSLDNAASGNFLVLATDGYPLLNRAYRIMAGKTSRRSTNEDATTLGTVISAGLYPNFGVWRMFLSPQNISEVLQVYFAGGGANPNTSLNCTSAGSVVALTSAALFDVSTPVLSTGMRAVHATKTAARTFVKSIESSSSLTLSDKTTAAFTTEAVSFRPVTGTPLQQEDYGRVLRMIQSEGTTGPPVIYGLRRAQAATLTGVGNIEMILYPIPFPTTADAPTWTYMYFPATVRYEIDTLSAATDVVDVEDGEDYTIGDMVAFWSLTMQGRDAIAQAMLAQLPDSIRDAAAQAAKTLPMKGAGVA